MNQLKTTSIILSRVNYAEADRILTLLTPDYGKLRVMARGVRKVKSKLAGGIELFSVSDVSFIRGRGEISTLVSTRLIKHYANITKNLDRTMLAYELLRQLNRAIEDEPGPEYFELLQQSFEALDDVSINIEIIKLWFAMQLLRLGGHTPNLTFNKTGQKLRADQKYNFDLDAMNFVGAPNGRFAANHIKFLRLGFSYHTPKTLGQVNGAEDLQQQLNPIVQAMLTAHIKV